MEDTISESVELFPAPFPIGTKLRYLGTGSTRDDSIKGEFIVISTQPINTVQRRDGYSLVLISAHKELIIYPKFKDRWDQI